MEIWGRGAFQAEGIAHTKALGQHHALHVGGTTRRLVWLEQSEQGEEKGGGKGREGVEKVLQGLVGCRRTWGFILREMGALKCCRQRGET